MGESAWGSSSGCNPPPLISPAPPLHRRFLVPEVRVPASSRHRARRPAGWEEEGEAVGLVCLSLLEKRQEVGQET